MAHSISRPSAHDSSILDRSTCHSVDPQVFNSRVFFESTMATQTIAPRVLQCVLIMRCLLLILICLV